jgi:hypothetical protein
MAKRNETSGTSGLSADLSSRVAVENAAVPGSATIYRPMRDGEAIRDGDGRIWSVGMVRGRLSEAAVVIERSTRKDAPSRKLGFWPAVEREFHEVWNVLVESAQAREDHQAERNRVRYIPSALEIARAEEAIGWPGRYLAAPAHDEERRWLQLWMWSEATGAGWEDLAEKAARAAGGDMSVRTVNRRRKSAFEVIMWGLVRDEIAP